MESAIWPMGNRGFFVWVMPVSPCSRLNAGRSIAEGNKCRITLTAIKLPSLSAPCQDHGTSNEGQREGHVRWRELPSFPLQALMGRLCGRHHQNVASIERQSGTHIEMSQPWFSDLLPSNKAEDNGGVEFDNIFIKGEHQATQVNFLIFLQKSAAKKM